jgi:hypothetical protein
VEERGEETAFPLIGSQLMRDGRGNRRDLLRAAQGENIVVSGDSSEDQLRLNHLRIYFCWFPCYVMGLMCITFHGYYNPCIELSAGT